MVDKWVTVPVKQSIPIEERWEKGIEHDPRSVSIMIFLAEYNYKYCNDYFCWKTGGDGDNGEQLMYELDEYFAAAPKPGDKPARCVWTEQENGPWETSCGEAWEFFEGGPSENRAHFCLYCGKPIEERLFVFPLEQSDER